MKKKDNLVLSALSKIFNVPFVDVTDEMVSEMAEDGSGEGKIFNESEAEEKK